MDAALVLIGIPAIALCLIDLFVVMTWAAVADTALFGHGVTLRKLLSLGNYYE